ncbi:hypothetical protein FXO38_35310 [Capsicum annuum]|nr:hypothetical protein FXO38_35310 [Capsicum annuum]KAF3619095.1 hypothetical protein FXO37_33892 [Capsicum annuum]
MMNNKLQSSMKKLDSWQTTWGVLTRPIKVKVGTKVGPIMIMKKNGVIEIKITIGGIRKWSMIDMYPHDRMKIKNSNPMDSKKFKAEDVLARILMRVKGADKMV